MPTLTPSGVTGEHREITVYTGTLAADSFPAGDTEINRYGDRMATLRAADQPIARGTGGASYLTIRQAEVLKLAAGGLSGKQIARYLRISVRTVEDHFSKMRQRTGARTNGELVAYGVAAGIVPSGLGPCALKAGRDDTAACVGSAGQDHVSNRSLLCKKGVENNACSLIQPGPVSVQSQATMATSSHPDEMLLSASGPEAGGLAGSLIGYTGVFTPGQNLDRQIRALKETGCIRVFTDRQPGKAATRTELTACLDYLRPGDTLVVPSLGCLSRSLPDLITLVAGLRRRELGFRSLHEALDTTTPGGRLVLHVFAALAEFIRERAIQGTNEGIQAAGGRGTRLGRPLAMTPEQVRHARALLTSPDNTISSIARLLGVSRSTIYKHVPELAGGRRTAAPALPGTHTIK
ncbi:MAG TPA: recombinase family protein [Streptosporangiaceae bacterium]|jgi:DNA invertase Pin-like site-specific DNA recombinase